VGGSDYNNYTELTNLPVYSDTNLLYTFHFYEPFIFTHQGRTWGNPPMPDLSGVPFPYNAATMPACPASLKGTWVESSINDYPVEGTEYNVRQLINIAINFRTQRKVKIFCGEFGVYIPNSNNADRCHWYKVVSDYFENNNIPWTSWDYKGDFGLFNKGSDQIFEHDLNVRLLDSLGLNVPPQTPLVIRPDSVGFLIYTDYIGQKIISTSYSHGPYSFYSRDLPANGQFCLSWSGFEQYNTIGFDFVPDKDLSKLVSEHYAIDFMVRGSQPGIKFEIRFTDTKTTDPNDHPWRMGATIDETEVPGDLKWHHVRIPLNYFSERGAWDNNTGYDPVGKFDWTKVDIFEIALNWTEILGKKLWFDNIHISNLDTAIVRVTDSLGIPTTEESGKPVLKISPNPMSGSTEISFNLSDKCQVTINIYSVTGSKICTLTNKIYSPGTLLFAWNGQSDNGIEADPGVYICDVVIAGHTLTGRILKY
jgi:endoglucanase